MGERISKKAEVDPLLPLSNIVRGKNETLVWSQIARLPRVFRSKDIEGLPNNVKNVTLRNLEAKGLIKRIEPGVWERTADEVVVGFLDTRIKKVLDLFCLFAFILLLAFHQYIAAAALLLTFSLYSLTLPIWVRVIRLTYAISPFPDEEKQENEESK